MPEPESNLTLAFRALEHLRPLLASPDFAWYVENVLNPAVASEAAKALNVKLPAEERDRAAWRHDALAAIVARPATALKAHEETLRQSAKDGPGREKG